jgi:HEAT repeat protein
MDKDINNSVLGESLDSRDMAGRYEAMLKMDESGLLQKNELEKLCLRDLDPFIRKRALRLLADRKEAGYIEVLRSALHDGDPMVRIVAAEQAYNCANEGEEISLADYLKPLLRDTDQGVCLRVISLLINSDEKEATRLVLEVFLEALESGEDRMELDRSALLLSLLKGPKIAKLLKKRLDLFEEEKRLKGLRSLEQVGIDL